MSDNYPRVQFGTSTWMPAANGAHKVVPADAIVIERSELPDVEIGVFHKEGASSDGPRRRFLAEDVDTAESLMADALACIALAEHLREHPPVDERDVESLGHMLAAHDVAYPNRAREVARRLLATGKVHVDTEGGVR